MPACSVEIFSSCLITGRSTAPFQHFQPCPTKRLLPSRTLKDQGGKASAHTCAQCKYSTAGSSSGARACYTHIIALHRKQISSWSKALTYTSIRNDFRVQLPALTRLRPQRSRWQDFSTPACSVEIFSSCLITGRSTTPFQHFPTMPSQTTLAVQNPQRSRWQSFRTYLCSVQIFNSWIIIGSSCMLHSHNRLAQEANLKLVKSIHIHVYPQ